LITPAKTREPYYIAYKLIMEAKAKRDQTLEKLKGQSKETP